MFGPSMVLVGQYFNKRRSLANGMAIGGGSCGQLIIPWFITGAVFMFAFRGGMLMYLGLALHALPAMCLLRDTDFYGPAPTLNSTPSEPRQSISSGKVRANEKYSTVDKVMYPSKMPAIGDQVNPLTAHRPSIFARHQMQHRPSIISLSAQLAHVRIYTYVFEITVSMAQYSEESIVFYRVPYRLVYTLHVRRPTRSTAVRPSCSDCNSVAIQSVATSFYTLYA
jgi:MFS family permease